MRATAARFATGCAAIMAASALTTTGPVRAAEAPAPTAVATKHPPRPILSYLAATGDPNLGYRGGDGAPFDTRRGIEVTWSPNPETPIIEANGAGSPPLFSARGIYGDPWTSTMAYDRSFRGGLTIASCAKEAQGRGLVTGAGPGGGPHVKRFHVDGGYVPTDGGFFAYDRSFRGGVTVACADLDGDGTDEIITGPGPSGGPNVKVFSQAGRLLASFFAEDPGFRGGIRVAAIPASGGRPGRIITAAGPGGGPAVRAFTPGGTQLAGVFCFDPAYNGGVTVAAGDVDRDGTTDVVCGSATGTSNVVFRTADLAPHPTLEGTFAEPGGAKSNGVRVAVAPASALPTDRGPAMSLIVGSGPSSPGGAAVQSFIGRPPLPVRADDGIVSGRVFHADGTFEPFGPGGGSRLFPDHGHVAIGTRQNQVGIADLDGANVRLLGEAAYASLVRPVGTDAILYGSNARDASGNYYVQATVVGLDGTGRRSPDIAGFRLVGASPDGSLALLYSNPSLNEPDTYAVWRTAVPYEVPRRVVARGMASELTITNDGTIVSCEGDDLRVAPPTGPARTLGTFTGCRYLVLSHDGTSVAVSSAALVSNDVYDYALRVVRLADGQATVLASQRAPRFRDLIPVAWSPDDTAVLAQVGAEFRRPFEALRLDGSSQVFGDPAGYENYGAVGDW